MSKNSKKNSASKLIIISLITIIALVGTIMFTVNNETDSKFELTKTSFASKVTGLQVGEENELTEEETGILQTIANAFSNLFTPNTEPPEPKKAKGSGTLDKPDHGPAEDAKITENSERYACKDKDDGLNYNQRSHIVSGLYRNIYPQELLQVPGAKHDSCSLFEGEEGLRMGFYVVEKYCVEPEEGNPYGDTAWYRCSAETYEYGREKYTSVMDQALQVLRGGEKRGYKAAYEIVSL